MTFPVYWPIRIGSLLWLKSLYIITSFQHYGAFRGLLSYWKGEGGFVEACLPTGPLAPSFRQTPFCPRRFRHHWAHMSSQTLLTMNKKIYKPITQILKGGVYGKEKYWKSNVITRYSKRIFNQLHNNIFCYSKMYLK